MVLQVEDEIVTTNLKGNYVPQGNQSRIFAQNEMKCIGNVLENRAAGEQTGINFYQWQDIKTEFSLNIDLRIQLFGAVISTEAIRSSDV